MRRDPSYYRVAEVALDEELTRLRQLPAFAGGPLPGREPELKVRKRTLAQAMEEGYGVAGPRPRSTVHGVYAEAIESTCPR